MPAHHREGPPPTEKLELTPKGISKVNYSVSVGQFLSAARDVYTC